MHRSLRGLVTDLEVRAAGVVASLEGADARLVDRVTNLSTQADFIRTEARALLGAELEKTELADEHFRQYRAYNQVLVLRETYELPLLQRFCDADAAATGLCWELLNQIGWRDDKPVLGCYSNSYYWTVPPLGLIGLPANEERRLLGVPVLAHELGHLAFKRDSATLVGDFHETLHACVNAASSSPPQGLSGAEAREFYIGVFYSWLVWLQEFVCDLFAAYLLGPALGHQMLRVACIHGHAEPLYEPLRGGVHPADDARMRAACQMLRRIGQQEAAEQIEGRWGGLAAALGQKPDARYSMVYPDELIRELADDVEHGCRRLGLSAYQPTSKEGHIPTLVNQAWDRVENDPASYASWEEKTLRHFGSRWTM